MCIKQLFRVLALTTLSFLSACSSTAEKTDPYVGKPAAYIYAVGHQALQKGHWNLALEAYQSLDSQYPFNSYTQKGDLESIYANYKNENPAIALTEADRYIKIYPADTRGIAYAYYMMGVIDFENGRGFLQRYLPYDMAAHNAQNYRTAFQNFKIVVTSYPDSPYSTDARRRMVYLNNTLGAFNMEVAEIYYKKGAYVAAANRAINVILHYPNTPSTEQALEMLTQCYGKLGLPELQTSAETVLKFNLSKQQTTKIR